MWLPPALLFFSLPGCFSDIQGPGSVSGPEQGSLTVQCHYKAKWETYKKWWCRGKVWDLCETLIQSTGSEQEVKKGRISIRDNHRDHVFTVTMDKLTTEDTNTYWCGIQKSGIDRGVQVKVTVISENSSWTPPSNLSSNPLVISSTSYIRTHYLLLVFVKVPILLILLGAVLWLKGPQRVPEEQWDMSEYAELSLDHMANDTAL